MTHGKEICKQLKSVRKRIAEENGIALDIPECTHHGPCRGTCPRCEAEVRYLENALAERLRLGKVATVAGLALGLATATAQATETCPPPRPVAPAVVVQALHVADSVTLKGTIVDDSTREALPFCNVLVTQDGKVVTGTTSGLDGHYSLKVAKGVYDVEFSFIGYLRHVRTTVDITQDTALDIRMKATETQLDGMIGILIENPVIEIGPDGGMNTEIQGVKVKVK